MIFHLPLYLVDVRSEIIGYAVVFFTEASAAQRAFEALHHQTIDQITFQCSISAHTAVSVLSHQLNPQMQMPPYMAQHANSMNVNNMNMDMYTVNNISNNNGNVYVKEDTASNNVGFTSSFYHPNNHNNNNMGNNIRSNGSSGFGLPAPPQNTSPRQMQPPYVASPMMDNLSMNATSHNLNINNNTNYMVNNNNNNNSLHPLLMASSSSSSSSLSLPQTKLSTNSSQMPQYPSNVNNWTNSHPTSHSMNMGGANHSQLHSLNNVNNTSSLSLHSLMSPTNSFYVTPSLTSQPSFFSTSSTTSLSTNNTSMNANLNATTGPSLKTVSVAGANQQEDDAYFANLAHFHSHKTH